jgi:hypothetical protein
MAPRVLVGKGRERDRGSARLAGDWPALHSTRSASRICSGGAKVVVVVGWGAEVERCTQGAAEEWVG